VTIVANNVPLLGGNSGNDSQQQNDDYGYYGN